MRKTDTQKIQVHATSCVITSMWFNIQYLLTIGLILLFVLIIHRYLIFIISLHYQDTQGLESLTKFKRTSWSLNIVANFLPPCTQEIVLLFFLVKEYGCHSMTKLKQLTPYSLKGLITLFIFNKVESNFFLLGFQSKFKAS